MKRYFIVLFLTVFHLYTWGQKYGNEWIKYNQTYYQFPVLQTGLHKLDFQQLQNANIPTSSFTSANIQVFGRESEVPLYVVDGGDNSFDAGDYLLFYAERNDGWLDSTLYTNPEGIGNPGYSLYNDTLYYFFTWNSSTNNKRFAESTDITFNQYQEANYIRWNQLIEYHQEYFEGKTIANISTSFYNDGEGYVRSKGVGPFNQDNGFNTSFRYKGLDAPLAFFQGKSYSRNNPLISNPDDSNHHTRWKLVHNDSILFDVTYRDIKSIDFRTSFGSGSLVDGTTQFRFQNVGDLPPGNDLQGMSFARLEFPKRPNLSGFNSGRFIVDNASGQTKIHLKISGINFSNPLFLSFGANPLKLNAVSTGPGSYQMLIPNNTVGLDQYVFFGSESTSISVSGLKAVNGSGNFTDFSALTSDSAILFVYHSVFQSGVVEYEQYRTSLSGGNYQVVKALIDELYLQFGGGIPKHINGVRRWSRLMYDQSIRKPAGLFLIGKGIREAPYDSFPFQSLGTRGSSSFYAQSLIPSFGQPSSD
ncbi:MAG: hypothetical protein KJ941_11995, partial [Bacteroidetes bacterium]|nr:hypothetical protein [Bacteroidota bacterium]